MTGDKNIKENWKTENAFGSDSARRPRVDIASRIFAPESAAAAFRLAALAQEFSEQGWDVQVHTVALPKAQQEAGKTHDARLPYKVKRFWVKRDSKGYVYGYLPYLSFDIPLFFRLLFARRSDLYICEPPPTTGVMVRLVSALKRRPYFYYAADIWSEGAKSAGAPNWVVKSVSAVEKFALAGAARVLSVSKPVWDSVVALAPKSSSVVVGNGVNAQVFKPDWESDEAQPVAKSAEDMAESSTADFPLPILGSRYLVYAGTASHWQGAQIFIDALARLNTLDPKGFTDVQLVFLGSGRLWEELQAHAEEVVPGKVRFVASVPPEIAAKWLSYSQIALASTHPDSGYEMAMPTKVFAAWACGTPVVYAGPGPIQKIMAANRGLALGKAVDYNVEAVAKAFYELLSDDAAAHGVSRSSLPYVQVKKNNAAARAWRAQSGVTGWVADLATPARREIAKWAKENYSLNAVSRRVVETWQEFNASRLVNKQAARFNANIVSKMAHNSVTKVSQQLASWKGRLWG